MLQPNRMDKTIHKYTNFSMKPRPTNIAIGKAVQHMSGWTRFLKLLRICMR